MTFGGVVGSSGSSGRPGASGSAGSAGSAGFSGSSGSSGSDGTSGTSGSSSTVISGSGVGSISEPGIVVVGAVVSGSDVGSSSEPGIVVSGAGSGSDSEVSNGDVVVGAVDSEGFGSEDAGSEDSGSGCAEVDVEDAEVGVDGSAAWVGSDVGSLVAELVVELEGSAVCFSVEAAVVVSVVVSSEVVFCEVDVLEVGRSDGSAGEDAAEDGSADVVLFVDSVVWEGSADWEDEEVAVGFLAAATWGAGSELEDGVEAGVV